VRLILASASPRRADLLRAAGYAFETLVVDVDERVRAGERPGDYVRRLAMEKAERADLKVCTTAAMEKAEGADLKVCATAVASVVAQAFRPADLIILAADTAVVVDTDILGKPRDDRDAERMLRLLSGRDHQVLTGVSLRGDGKEAGRVITTVVRFNRLTDADVAWYLASGEGRDKAGAYAIQGLASRFIPQIDGSYANVVGLPVEAIDELIRQLHPAYRRDILTGY
jgi:septum formation protein